MTKRRKRGLAFTLIELMVAMAIIALLAAIALPRFVTARYRAYLAACLTNERNLATALESYRTDNHSYPTVLNVVMTSGTITKIPACPSNPTTPYQYEVSPDGETFTMSCLGYHSFQLTHIQPGFPQYTAQSGINESGP